MSSKPFSFLMAFSASLALPNTSIAADPAVGRAVAERWSTKCHRGIALQRRFGVKDLMLSVARLLDRHSFNPVIPAFIAGTHPSHEVNYQPCRTMDRRKESGDDRGRDGGTADAGPGDSFMGGKPPAPPVEGPRPGDQINLTDEDSRIMKVPGGGFDQCYNPQAAVATGSLLVVAVDVSKAADDKQHLEPILVKVTALPAELGKPETMLADTGYYSATNVTACHDARISPLIAMGREPHHQALSTRFAEAPPAPINPTLASAMAHRLKTPEGKKLYGLRKQTPEPVFGIIKSVLGFRQFSLRGLDKVRWPNGVS